MPLPPALASSDSVKPLFMVTETDQPGECVPIQTRVSCSSLSIRSNAVSNAQNLWIGSGAYPPE
ncbi:hypothetical protein GCM10010404_92500 [Nonomuraea africana]